MNTTGFAFEVRAAARVEEILTDAHQTERMRVYGATTFILTLDPKHRHFALEALQRWAKGLPPLTGVSP